MDTHNSIKYLEGNEKLIIDTNHKFQTSISLIVNTLWRGSRNSKICGMVTSCREGQYRTESSLNKRTTALGIQLQRAGPKARELEKEEIYIMLDIDHTDPDQAG